jgi:hypothetical protein
MATTGPRHALSTGEIFDRALTVYVKNWRPLSVLGLVLMLPYAAYDLGRSDITAAPEAGPHGSAAPATQVLPAIWRVMEGPPHPDMLRVLVTVGVASLIAAILCPAFVFGVNAGADNRMGALAEWLTPGLKRVPRVVGVLGLWIAGLIAFAAGAFLLSIPVLLVAAAAQSPTFVVIATYGIFLPVALLAAIIALVSGPCSLYVAVAEDKAAFEAFKGGLRQTLGRGRFWKTAGIGLALVALTEIFGLVLGAAATGFSLWTRSPMLFAAGHLAVRVPLETYAWLVTAAYYRTFEEGVKAPQN